jgi:hypothetical protein
LATGVIDTIVVQNIATSEYFRWSRATRTWDKPPKVQQGKAVYIALWSINTGATGSLWLSIQNSAGYIYATKTQSVARNAGFGLEYNATMPMSDFNLLAKVSP